MLELEECSHTTVIIGLCGDCGADLRQNENGGASNKASTASVPMIHSVPELKVTEKRALELGQADTDRLLQDRKLVLLVDLDQTLIHTTNDNVPNNLKAVYHFQLYGANSPWYHTRLRPGTLQFLEKMSKFFELHICTFGARKYAHTIAVFLDEYGKYFSHRILSRDECFSSKSKTDNLKALFPCGDSMVCIIDDREDVWNNAPNLIQVKPYHFFQHTGDINAPPGMAKHELDGEGIDFNNFDGLKIKKPEKPAAEDEGDAKKASDDKDEKKEGIEVVEDINEKLKKDETETKAVNVEKGEEKTVEPAEKKAESNKAEEEVVRKVDEVEFDSAKEKSKPDAESPSSTNQDDDNLIEIEDPDDYLLYLEEILCQIHTRFYKIYDDTQEIPDLKMLVPKIRGEVLLGQNLVFSGLIPNKQKLEDSKAYKIARSLGAHITHQIHKDTTHLVAAKAGTFKTRAAQKFGKIKIVNPDWLWSCAERWEYVEERLFPLDPNNPSKTRNPPAHCHSPEHKSEYSFLDAIETNSPGGSSSSQQMSQQLLSSTRKDEPKFMDTINPLLKFTNDDLEKMNEEFEEFFESSSSSDDDEPRDIESPPMAKNLRRKRKREAEEEVNINFFTRPEADTIDMKLTGQQDGTTDQTTTDNGEGDESGSGSSSDDMPSTKFRKGGDLPSDLDMGTEDESQGSEPPLDEDDDGDWNMMGAALEREFLGLDQ